MLKCLSRSSAKLGRYHFRVAHADGGLRPALAAWRCRRHKAGGNSRPIAATGAGMADLEGGLYKQDASFVCILNKKYKPVAF